MREWVYKICFYYVIYCKCMWLCYTWSASAAMICWHKPVKIVKTGIFEIFKKCFFFQSVLLQLQTNTLDLTINTIHTITPCAHNPFNECFCIVYVVAGLYLKTDIPKLKNLSFDCTCEQMLKSLSHATNLHYWTISKDTTANCVRLLGISFRQK